MIEHECPNCGHINEVEVHEDGHCEHCGLEYYWREWNGFTEMDDCEDDVILIWEDTFADLSDEDED